VTIFRCTFVLASLVVLASHTSASTIEHPFTMDGFNKSHAVITSQTAYSGLESVSSFGIPIQGSAGSLKVQMWTKDRSKRIYRRKPVVLLQVGDLYVKTVRGRRTEGNLARSMRYEVDTCIMDKDGNVLFQRFGGHDKLIPECSRQIELESTSSFGNATRVAMWPSVDDTRLYRDTVAAGLSFISSSGSGSKRWLPEERAIVGTLHAISGDWHVNPKSTLVDVSDDLEVTVIEEPIKDLSTVQRHGGFRTTPPPIGRTTPPPIGRTDPPPIGRPPPQATPKPPTERWYYEIWSGPKEGTGGWTTGFWSFIYEHSAVAAAVRLSRPVNGRDLVAKWCACNHGRCPGVCGGLPKHLTDYGVNYNGMNYRCGSTINATNRGSNPRKAWCTTPYSLVSIWGTHNCHDDTVIESLAILWNAQMVTNGVFCADNKKHRFTPRIGGCG
jgi:hypothetical protein